MAHRTVAMPDEVALAHYERASADRHFRARFQAAYSGDHDPMNALWWAAYPDRPSPSGAASPYEGLVALRRDVYRPGASDTDRAEYQRLSMLLKRERQHVADAADAASGSSISRPRSRRRQVTKPWRAMLVGVLAALVVGGVVGVVGTLRVDAAQPERIPTLALESAVHGRATLRVFARVQRADDLPIMRLGPTIVRSSIRHLLEEPVTETQLFAAQDRDGDVCLLAVHDSVYTASCVTRAGFARVGIVLSWTQPSLAATASGVSARAGVPVLSEWLPSGVVLTQARL